MKKNSFFILIFLCLVVPFQTFAQCSIDGTLSPELTKYKQDIQNTFSKLRQIRTTSCGPTSGGAIAQFNKSIELYDKAKITVPAYGEILTDFRYNFELTLRWEGRSAVKKNGEIFQTLLTSVMYPTIDSLASTCNLTSDVEKIIQSYITTNILLETIYKKVALGEIPPPTGVPEEYMKVYDEIIKMYNTQATASCKEEYNFGETLNKLLDSFSKWTFGMENAWSDWQEAIALFSGKKVQNKDKTAQALRNELIRQWLTKNAVDVMVKNFYCVNSRDNGEWTVSDLAHAIADCKQFPIVWLDRLASALDSSKYSSPNREVYVERLLKSDDIIRDNKNINTLYVQLQWESKDDININDTLLNELIKMHINILSANALLDKGVKEMQKNCMIPRPDIEGGCLSQ